VPRQSLFLRALAALLSGGGALAAQGAARPVVVDHTPQPGQAVRVGPGQILEIRLKVQFGTGYSWQVARPLDPGLEELPGSVLPAPKSGVEGGFETQVFRFRAAQPLDTALTFKLRRPWDPPETAPRSTFRLERVRFGRAKALVRPPGP
jgi:hypothetical protein